MKVKSREAELLDEAEAVIEMLLNDFCFLREFAKQHGANWTLDNKDCFQHIRASGLLAELERRRNEKSN